MGEPFMEAIGTHITLIRMRTVALQTVDITKHAEIGAKTVSLSCSGVIVVTV